MTDEEKPEANITQPPILINNQYIKDLSLEIPHAPEIFAKMNQKPELKVEMSVQSQKLTNNNHNVCLNIALNGDIDGEKLFILELSYAAVVTLNVPSEHIEPVLAVEIPRLLFPFARNVVTQCLVEGGLPPFMLTPVDFGALYLARQNTNAKQQ